MSKDSRSLVRDQMLQAAYEERAQIMIKMAEPEMQKDKSENSGYDLLRADLATVEFKIDKLLSGKLAPIIPGTFNVGDFLLVTYTKIVSYGKEKPLPEYPIKIQLVDFFDITELTGVIDVNNVELLKVPTSSKLGQAIINKAHRKIRFNTSNGYCEIEIEPLPTGSLKQEKDKEVIDNDEVSSW